MIRQASIPGVAELMIAPGPLLLAGRDIMIRHVNYSGIRGVIGSSKEVLFRLCDHVAGRHGNV